jgi:phosphopantetheinyl transferase
MPALFSTHTEATTQLAVWKITEPELFFSATIGAGKKISHPHKRLQHLCGRHLLRYLVPHFPLKDVVAEQDNKPFLPGHPFHFSISHSGDYAAAIVSTSSQVGIDVEKLEDKVLRLRQKFLSPEEELVMKSDRLTEIQTLTLAWSAKETLFKWLGEAGVDFKAQLRLHKLNIETDGTGVIVAHICRAKTYELNIQYQLFDDIVLTWLQTPPTSS